MKTPLVLMFIASMTATAEETTKADEIRETGCRVVLRNASLVPSVGNLEAHDAVAGAVPASYKGSDTPKQAMAKYKAAVKKAAKKAKDDAKEASVNDYSSMILQTERDIETAKKQLVRSEARVEELEATLDNLKKLHGEAANEDENSNLAAQNKKAKEAEKIKKEAEAKAKQEAEAKAKADKNKTDTGGGSSAANAGWTSNK